MLPLLLVLTVAISDVTSASSCSSVATFNVAMTHSVERNYETRADDVIDALDRLDADLVCLQEVWLESDMHKILDKLGGKYPNHYSSIHHRQGELRKPMSFWERMTSWWRIYSSCSWSDGWFITSQVLPCAFFKGCLTLLSEDEQKGLRCISQQCGPAMMKVQRDCLSCVVLHTGGISEVSEACLPDFTERHNDLNPSGLLLLSKTPMTGVQYKDYFPDKRSILTRGSLEAEVPDIGKVVCTHLTSMFPVYFEYDLDFDNFTAQQRAEISELLERFGDQPHLLMGDLNTGPVVLDMEDRERNLTGEEEENFKMLLQAGYSSHYLQADGRCTFCNQNPLVDNYNNVAIDYILSKNHKSLDLSNTYRVLDQVKPRPLSDHFGVMAEVCPDQE